MREDGRGRRKREEEISLSPPFGRVVKGVDGKEGGLLLLT